MSFYDDYIADGLCCQCCGVYLDGSEPGHPRSCSHCREPDSRPTPTQKRNARKRRAKQRARQEQAAHGQEDRKNPA